MKKILLMLVIFIVLFLILVFKAPIVAWTIWDLLWLHWINEKIVDLKNKFDNAITRMPNKEELKDTYNKAYSWTIEIIDKTKNTIDTVRENANKLENKYNNTKKVIKKTWEKIDKIKWTINDLEKIWNDINNVINTWAVN